MSESIQIEHEWSFVGNQYRLRQKSNPVDTIPCGCYTVDTDRNGTYLVPTELRSDKLLISQEDNEVIQVLLREAQIFWDNEAFYRNAKIAYKRGYLFHGRPGTGKTALLRQLALDMSKQDAICVVNTLPMEIRNLFGLLDAVNDTRRVIVVFDDLDNTVRSFEDELLELMDGIQEVHRGILWLAATNHLDEIPDRLKNRPSRFDRVLTFSSLTAPVRSQYIRMLLPEISSEKLTEIVQMTNGFTFAELKEVVLSTHLFGESVETVCRRIRTTYSLCDADSDPSSQSVTEYKTGVDMAFTSSKTAVRKTMPEEVECERQ